MVSIFPDAVAVTQAGFGAGSGRIYLNNLFCTGSESSLLECPRGDPGVKYCSHRNDAGVICIGEGINLGIESGETGRGDGVMWKTIQSYFAFCCLILS